MGQVLGRYHIISELGRGGMGVVYKALDPKLERFIAIKCLSEELSNDEIVVARFLREARNVAALNHPNIAQIFVADEHEGKPYFVMEYVDGESLADFIEREGQCTPEMARRVTEQSAEALAAAAEENIVHRDVKPGNIMLDRRGRAVLTDFGIACVVASQSESGPSSTLMGTPGYLPPEALTGQQPDQRGDLFSLGLVYFEMLTGRRLVENTDLKAMMGQFMDPSFPDLGALEGKVDDRVIKIIRRMLAVKPDERYPDCRSLLEAMAPLKTGKTGPVERSESRPTTAETEATVALAATGAVSATATTRTVDADVGERPETVPVSGPARSGRARRYGLLGALALMLVMIALGVARMDERQWNRVTGVFSGNDEAPAVAEVDVEIIPEVTVIDVGPVAEPEPAVLNDEDSTSDGEHLTLIGQALVIDESEVAQPAAAEPLATEPAVEPGMAATEGTDRRVEDSRQPVSEPKTGTEVAVIATPAPPPPPRGVAVVGVGDPVITDPMVREIEQTLRGSRAPLVDRGFIGNLQRYLQADEIDLAGLAEPALAAGARYVVVARAVPAGTRELQFYNRYETAYIVQLEAVTYDLHQGRQIGSSPLKQIEYTSLNATERARESVQPWLSGIRDHFD